MRYMIFLIFKKSMYGDHVTTQMNKKVTKLFQIAEGQHGYFTAKQAASAGFLPTNFTYHVKAGTWTHEGTGIYRLKNFPTSRESQMAYFALWSRNREDEIQGAYSHETALSIQDLSDVNPSKLHMTVPTTFRKSVDTPKILILHFGDLDQSEIQTINGIKITSPLRTLTDVFKSPTSHEFVEQAVQQAYAKGLISLSDIRSSVPQEISTQFLKWIDRTEKNRKRKEA